MKKYILLAVAALTLSAACTKVETVAPDQKIAFDVVNYATQTRANTVFAEEWANASFFTNAWYYPTPNDNPQPYMDNVEIKLTEGAWQPDEAYYWPRTGLINFFSYASKKPLSNNYLTAGNGTFTINEYTVTADDNIMIADAVYNAGKNDHNADGALVVTGDNQTNNYKGVPTLFRHLLSQISVNVQLKTAQEIKGTNAFEATLTGATIKNVANVGSLALTAGTTQATGLATAAWTPASDGTQVGWTLPASTVSTENITLEVHNTVLKINADTKESENVNLLNNRTVLPQALTAGDPATATVVALEIAFQLVTKHGDTAYATENVTLTANLRSEAVASWNMNQRIVYNVTIDPVGEVITFDPAVAAWVEAPAQTVPFSL
ncbi:MAG: hypothetical protein IJT26_02505 [Bacteroidales bacterium]|nr:hypothetical protein [Bacteroidales bacterium]